MLIVQKDQVAMIQQEVSNALKLGDENKVRKSLEIKSSSHVRQQASLAKHTSAILKNVKDIESKRSKYIGKHSIQPFCLCE